MSNILEKQLLVAIFEYDVLQVKELLDSNPLLDINYRSINLFENRTALELALDRYNNHPRRYIKIIEEIMKKNVIIYEKIIKKALLIQDDDTTLKLILEKPIDIFIINKLYKNHTLLMYAIIIRDIILIKLLLNQNADVNFKNNTGQTAIMILLENSNLANDNFNETVCKLLLEAGAEVNIKDKSNKNVIEYINTNLTDKVKFMILEKLNINPLMRAIVEHNRDELSYLISSSSSSRYINSVDSRNETAIFYFARYYNFLVEIDGQILQNLLDYTVTDLTMKNCDNQTVLDLLLDDIRKYKNNYTTDSKIFLLAEISKKLMDKEVYNKDLKIKNILNLYFPQVLVNNIITKYSK